MPTPKQMEKLAAEAKRKVTPQTRGTQTQGAKSPEAPDQPLPAEYWDAVLKDPRVRVHGIPIQQRRLSEIPRHVLRVVCRRCERIVEIQMVDAMRLYGANAIWKDVGQRLLDNTCTERTGRYEEDGCWPFFGTP